MYFSRGKKTSPLDRDNRLNKTSKERLPVDMNWIALIALIAFGGQAYFKGANSKHHGSPQKFENSLVKDKQKHRFAGLEKGNCQ